MKADQQREEKANKEADRKLQEQREDARLKAEQAKRDADAAAKQTTVIQSAPPPVVVYPPYSPHYWRPWWSY